MGYCSTIYSELDADLLAFNLLLQVPPTWTPIPGGPTVFAANLNVANANNGPGLVSSGALTGILSQLNEEKALGVQAVLVQVGFPMLYAPFLGGATQLQPYLTFYQGVAQAAHALGLKLIVENDILLTSDIAAGWPNLAAYFSTLSWDQYVQARATMAATIAETMQPDYLVLAEEPNTEAAQANQPNLNDLTYVTQMVAAEIAAVRASTFPGVILGAGFGCWPQHSGGNTLQEYTSAYAALPLDYIDSHIYPINTVGSGSLIDDFLTIASVAAAAGKPVALSEAWLWKMENLEWHVLSADEYRGRDPFSFWAPLDNYFQQTMQALAKYTNMVYLAEDGPDYLFTYQTFGGTTTNGGAANCTCTTTYCDSYNIMQTENQLVRTANQTSVYTTTGFGYSSLLVPEPDKIGPSTPSNLTGSAGYSGSQLSWTESTDNVGVAGYNVFRCSPPAFGQACNGVWIANTSTAAFTDSGLTENTPYNYRVQAFDLANNHSAVSSVLRLQTDRSSPLAPSNLVGTVVSAAEVDLSWSPPQSATGLTQYLIFSGPTSSSLVQIDAISSNRTTYRSMSLNPSTVYYFGVEAVESGVDSPMSPTARTVTLPLPTSPSSVTATPLTAAQIVLTWQEQMAKNGLPIADYEIWRGTSPGQLTKINKVTGTTFTNKALIANTTYYYQIVAVDSAGNNSPPSTQVSATTLP